MLRVRLLLLAHLTLHYFLAVQRFFALRLLDFVGFGLLDDVLGLCLLVECHPVEGLSLALYEDFQAAKHLLLGGAHAIQLRVQ